LSGDITVTSPSDDEIIAWWNWASRFPKISSPFQPGWGNNGIDRNNQNQPQDLLVFCLSCTAGVGGVDTESRPLDAAKRSNREILVPVYVAGSEIDAATAKGLLGETHTVEFFINGNPAPSFFRDGKVDPSFYKETPVGSIEYVLDNSFDEEAKVFNPYFSAGYWAKVSSSGLENMQFGGRGGKQVEYIISNGQKTTIDKGAFHTSVTYGI